MELFLLGTSQSVASLGTRERMHVELDGIYRALSHLKDVRGVLEEAIPLSTCGRMEIYGVAEDPDRVLRLLTRMACAETGVGLPTLREHSYMLRGHEAVIHLLRVAAGLESAVHGEAQILGQVRDALHSERTRAVEGPRLHRLFQRAITTGKRVRTETSIGRGAASLASASLALLEREVGALNSLRTVVLGAGETGALVGRLLVKAGVTRITVANRTVSKAESLAREIGGRAARLDELPGLIAGADLVVGAVEAPHRILEREQIETLGDEAPGYLLDLAHPRNFAPDLDELPNIRVFDLEDVFDRVEAARERRAAQVPQAEAIVMEEAAVYRKWTRTRGNVGVVRAVRSQLLELAEAEADRHGRGLPPEAREALEGLARSLARTMLHQPTVALREADPETREGRILLESASVLFGIGDASTTPEDSPTS